MAMALGVTGFERELLSLPEVDTSWWPREHLHVTAPGIVLPCVEHYDLFLSYSNCIVRWAGPPPDGLLDRRGDRVTVDVSLEAVTLPFYVCSQTLVSFLSYCPDNHRTDAVIWLSVIDH